MSKGRKTFEVEKIREIANGFLKSEWSGHTKEFREGVMAMVENILMESNNYHGFTYLEQRELPDLSTPGIRSGETYEEKFSNTDHTRVYYF